MFRSEDVSCYQVYFSKEQTEQVCSELGYMGSVEFEDLRPHEMESQKPYTAQLSQVTEDFKKL